MNKYKCSLQLTTNNGEPHTFKIAIDSLSKGLIDIGHWINTIDEEINSVNIHIERILSEQKK